MCRPMSFLCLAYQNIAEMDKLYYFILQNDRMLTKFLKCADYLSEHLLAEGLKKILEYTRDATSIFVYSEE